MIRAFPEPYLHVRRIGAGYQIAGETRFFRGHQLPGPSPDRPDGMYVGWHWDGRELSARTCRYGGYPVYYFASATEFAISPSLERLLELGAPREWDEAALAVLIRFRICLGDDTVFKAIRTLPAASTLSWREGRISVLNHRRPLSPTHLTRDEAIDAFIATFRSAIARRKMGDRALLPLSGGRDSRHILLELCHQDQRPPLLLTSRHLPPKPDEDARIAALLAHRLGLPHRILPATRSRAAAELEKNRLTGFTILDHAWFLENATYVNAHADLVYDGLGGDTFAEVPQWNDRVARHYADGDIKGLATLQLGRAVYPMASDWALNGLLTPKWRHALRFEVAVERLALEIAKHLDAPHPLTAFQFANRGRRGNALMPLCLYDPRLTVYTPYLDNSVLDLMATLPPWMGADHTLHTEAIHRAYPQFRDIPFENRSAPYRRDPAYVRRMAFDLLGMIARHPKSEVTRAGWLAPRLVDLAVRGDIDGVRRLGLVPFLYLLQLEEITLRAGG